MKTPSFSTIVLCALGIETVLAMPSMHNVHRHLHKKKDVDYNNPELYKDVDWKKVFMPSNVKASDATATADAVEVSSSAPAPTTSAEAAPSPSAAAPPAPSASASSSSGSGSGGCGTKDSDGFCTEGFGGRTGSVANGNVDQYKGNVGSPYGKNMQTVDSSSADSYKYTNEFKSEASDTITIVVWNKSGPDGQPNSGQFSAPALSFDLSPGASQFVAFDENSQIAWCHDTGKKTAFGAYDCTFGEGDFGNLSNGGWSGYDVSSIQNTNGNSSPMTISCPNGETSSNTGNNYISDSQAGGIGGNLSPGKVRLTTSIA